MEPTLTLDTTRAGRDARPRFWSRWRVVRASPDPRYFFGDSGMLVSLPSWAAPLIDVPNV